MKQVICASPSHSQPLKLENLNPKLSELLFHRHLGCRFQAGQVKCVPPGVGRGGRCGSFAPHRQRKNTAEMCQHGFGQRPGFTGLTGQWTDASGGEAGLTRQTQRHTQRARVRRRRMGTDTAARRPPGTGLSGGQQRGVSPGWGPPVSPPAPRLRCAPLPPLPVSALAPASRRVGTRDSMNPGVWTAVKGNAG